MKALPEQLDVGAMIGALRTDWALDVVAADYVPVGAGSYHWEVRDSRGRRRFVTVDDLDRKPWLGSTRGSALEGLKRSFEYAGWLRESGLTFVVAPIRTILGEILRPVGPRYTVAVFPFLSGRAGESGHHAGHEERIAVLRMLAQIHQAPLPAHLAPPPMDLGASARQRLRSVVEDTARGWSGGSYSEPARELLDRHSGDVKAGLAKAEALASQLVRNSSGWVITHGEPHARNVMHSRRGRDLIDWDTVAVGPIERDLWMVTDGASAEVALYADLTGRRIESAALAYFRLAWDLADLDVFLDVLRSPHDEDDDTRLAFQAVTGILSQRDVGRSVGRIE